MSERDSTIVEQIFEILTLINHTIFISTENMLPFR